MFMFVLRFSCFWDYFGFLCSTCAHLKPFVLRLCLLRTSLVLQTSSLSLNFAVTAEADTLPSQCGSYIYSTLACKYSFVGLLTSLLSGSKASTKSQSYLLGSEIKVLKIVLFIIVTALICNALQDADDVIYI